VKALTRTQAGITCTYCGADPNMPCEERERGPLTLSCLLQEELDLEAAERLPSA
jgi:hypothetical protein